MDAVKVSKYMSYLLRHHPGDLQVSRDGFVSVQQLLDKLKRRFPGINQEFLGDLVKDDGSRFELKDEKIRASHTLLTLFHAGHENLSPLVGSLSHI